MRVFVLGGWSVSLRGDEVLRRHITAIVEPLEPTILIATGYLESLRLEIFFSFR